MGAGQDELAVLEKHLAARTRVCAYDRAGVRESDPAAATPRSLDELVADLDAFAGATHAAPPFVLAGQSLGATVVLRYAQTHPAKVSGVLSMNPVPPARTYLGRVKPVETAAEYADEEAFYRGENDEKVDLTGSEKQLADPMPSTLPYTVMFDEDCDGDTDFCNRVLPALIRTTQELAARGPQGTFVRRRPPDPHHPAGPGHRRGRRPADILTE
jgi:pimeloyl-ACP methyl ester carboxylesterase